MKRILVIGLICFVALLNTSSAKSYHDYGVCLQFETIDSNPDPRVFGFNETVSITELIEEWDSKIRKSPKSLMIAKAQKESGFHPVIFRYEEIYKTYCSGLFQVMKPTVKLTSISEQVDEYDNLMSCAINKAGGDIKKAIFLYNSPSLSYWEAPFVSDTYNLYVLYSYM